MQKQQEKYRGILAQRKPLSTARILRTGRSRGKQEEEIRGRCGLYRGGVRVQRGQPLIVVLQV